MRVRPNDKDARMKYQECNKIVKQKAFERAIASDEIKKSVVDSLDIENMSKLYSLPIMITKHMAVNHFIIIVLFVFFNSDVKTILYCSD